MQKLLSFFIAVFLGMLGAGNAHAMMDCRQYKLEQQYNMAVLIFEGRVSTLKLAESGSDYTAKFDIQKIIKGGFKEKEITIKSHRSPYTTYTRSTVSFQPGYKPFQLGKRYLVYAYERPRPSKYKHLPVEYMAYLLPGCTATAELPGNSSSVTTPAEE